VQVETIDDGNQTKQRNPDGAARLIPNRLRVLQAVLLARFRGLMLSAFARHRRHGSGGFHICTDSGGARISGNNELQK
jgi:hypothetical protein